MDEFEEEKQSIERENAFIKELNQLNKQLLLANQIFLHPYCHGYEIKDINDLIKESENPNDAIVSYFGQKFFQLKTNLSILHGFCGRQPYLSDYMSTITRSISLCLQHEYQGAISILLPVIEGTLRKYMIDKYGEQNNVSKVSMKQLLDAIKGMRSDYLEKLKGTFEGNDERFRAIDSPIKIEELLELNGTYFDLWSEQFEIFIKDYLFKDTRSNEVLDDLNRHVITHNLKDDIDFSFKNYLRVYHSIFHLSWLINSAQANGSPFSEPDENIVFNEWISLLNILLLSESSLFVKEQLYGQKIESFKKYLSSDYNYILGRSIRDIDKILRRLHIDATGRGK